MPNINQEDQIADTEMLPNEDIQNEISFSQYNVPGTSELQENPSTFKVDRRQIAEVQLSDETVELQTLGLSVYDQDALEQGILHQVDQALEELDRQKLEQRMKAVADDILTCEQDLKKTQLLLKALELTGLSGQKQAVTVKKSIEVKSKQLKTLHVLAANLKLKYDGNSDVKADLTNEITISKTISGKRREQESERERKIRLGEMTPFGNALGFEVSSSARNNEGMTEFEKYLQSQAELEKKQKKLNKTKVKNKINSAKEKEENESNDDVISQKNKKRSPLKRSILLPKKRKKKEKLGTRSSDDWQDQKKKPGKLLSEETALEDSEGSEYLPSESEIEEVEKEEKRMLVTVKQKRATYSRRRKQHYQNSEEWGTDDSDWDYSDEDTRAKRRKSTKKEIDDGNLEDYHERLKLWEEQKARQPESEHRGDHEMEGGYKIPKELWTKLYNYQKVGVQWLWELNQQRCGGILGDEMGLGKTVQIIAFLAGLNHSKLISRHGNFRGLGPNLVICPTTVMHQWVREFHVWWPQFRVAVLHESGSFHGKRQSLINQMNHVGCILVTSYVGAVQHQDTLIMKNWHYVILDEGHKIRNPDAQVTLAVKQFKTPHRLILSGSPMQNNLKELWSLFDFVFPGKLGTLPVFLAQMAVPITQGGYSNASEVQVATAYRCAMVLRDTIAPYLLRRMKADVKSHIHLPPKNEQVLFCRLTEEQRSLYKSYLDSGEVDRILQGRFQVFVGLIALRKICNHPDLYSGGPKLLRGEKEEDLPEEARYGYWKRAGKMLVVESLLSIWFKQKHRVLLFTQSRQMLCILEAFIQKKGYKYLKLDGGTGIASRQPLITKFNQDASYFIFILTTRVGGLGVNLTGADRVVIYDPDWNPATDTQARERAWRIGQQNNVTVYRLVTAGTIEEKIYHRQIFKQFLCNKVLRDPRQRRFFKSNDLLELFTLAESERTTETAAIFAGTGSEVKLSYKRSKSEKDKLSHKEISDSKPSKSKVKVEKNVEFSESKLEHMKRLAKLLSKQIVTSTKVEASKPDGNKTEESPDGSKTEGSEMKITSCESTENCKSSMGSIEETCTNKYTLEAKVENCENVETKEESVHNSELKLSAFNNVSELGENKLNTKRSGKSNCGNTDTIRGHGKEHSHHTKKHSRRKRKGVVFEGERIHYLVGQSEAKMQQCEDEESSAQQDDYVLRKLFKKSGIQTAMRHDTIMEGGDADYALVEGEARRVAKEAIKTLKESRRQCWQADIGVPSWTGQNGAIRLPSASSSKLRFGKKKSIQESSTKPGSMVKSVTSEENNDQPMSSSELLSRMRSRNRLLEPLSDQPELQERQDNTQEENPSPSNGTSWSSVPIQEEHMELLTDIRNFIAFGASVDGRASTQEILSRFRDRLPPGSSPLFKFMLSEICEFLRMPSGEGVWKLRTEFRW